MERGKSVAERKRRDLNDCREKMIYQLEHMEYLFSGLARSYVEEAVPIQQRKRELAYNLWEYNGEQYCRRCSNKKMCQNRVPVRLLQQGFLRKEDIFSFMTCHGGEPMLQRMNQIYQNGLLQLAAEVEFHKHKACLEKQYRAAAGLIREELQRLETEEIMTIEEKRLRQQAKGHGIEIRECQLIDRDGHVDILCRLRIKKGEKTTRAMAAILSDICKIRLKPHPQSRKTAGNQWTWIRFMEEPGFYALTGMAQRKKDGERVCGEQFAVKSLEEKQLAAMICDGLGTGSQAGKESRQIMERMELLLESGISLERTMELIKSSFFFFLQRERYVAVDLVLLDLYTGIGQFVKFGAAEAILLRRERIERITGTQPPIGFEETGSWQIRKKLEAGDWIVLMSDGVIDGFGGLEVLLSYLEGYERTSPQALCQELLQQVSNEKDDCTVITIGIWDKYYAKEG